MSATAAGKPLLVYLNVPFCRSKCHFCDWVSLVPTRELRLVAEDPQRQRYVAAVREQIHALGPALRGSGYTTAIMYWGGGTATSLSCEEISTLHHCLESELGVGTAYEQTIEGSPDTFDAEKLSLFRELGFNRISIGVQSLIEQRLRKIGRSHSAEQARASVEAAAAAGFRNINIDLIVGFMEEGPDEVADSLGEALGLGANHYSIYPYRAAPGTILRKQTERQSVWVELDRQLRAYRVAGDILSGAGYPEYAMSYFGDPPCLSDQAYYELDMDWVGFGAGANSLIGGRYLATNKGRLDTYSDNPLAFDVSLPASAGWLTAHFLSQALTTGRGMSAAAFEARTGIPLRTACAQPEPQALLRRMAKFGRVIVDRDGIRIPAVDRASVFVALSRVDAEQGDYGSAS